MNKNILEQESQRIVPLIREYLDGNNINPTQKELMNLTLYFVNGYKFTLGEIEYINRCVECEIPFKLEIGTPIK